MTETNKPNAKGLKNVLQAFLDSDRKVKGRFVLETKLGEGGRGAVFKATDSKFNNDFVALKFLRFGDDDEWSIAVTRKAAEHEATATRQCSGNGVIQCHEYFEIAGYVVLVLQYIERAKTLRRVIDEFKEEQSILDGAGKRKRFLDLIQLVIQVCRALDEMHFKKNWLHGDVKPENILVTPNEKALLCDLGLAKSIEHSQQTIEGESGQHSSREVLGQELTDERADIWSVGIILYELIRGKLPFGGEADDRWERSRREIAAKKRPATPRSDYCKEDDPIATTCLKCLEFDQSERFGDFATVVSDLSALTSDFVTAFIDMAVRHTSFSIDELRRFQEYESDTYIERTDIEWQIAQLLHNSTKRALVLTGKSGGGKSASLGFISDCLNQRAQRFLNGDGERPTACLLLLGSELSVPERGSTWLLESVWRRLGLGNRDELNVESPESYRQLLELIDSQVHEVYGEDFQFVVIAESINVTGHGLEILNDALRLIHESARFKWFKLVVSVRADDVTAWNSRREVAEGDALERVRPFLQHVHQESILTEPRVAPGAMSAQSESPLVELQLVPEIASRIYRSYRFRLQLEPKTASDWNELPKAVRDFLDTPLLIRLYLEINDPHVYNILELLHQFTSQKLQREYLDEALKSVISQILRGASAQCLLSSDAANSIRSEWASQKSSRETKTLLDPVEGLVSTGLMVADLDGDYRFKNQKISEYLIYSYLVSVAPSESKLQAAYWREKYHEGIEFPEYRNSFRFHFLELFQSREFGLLAEFMNRDPETSAEPVFMALMDYCIYEEDFRAVCECVCSQLSISSNMQLSREMSGWLPDRIQGGIDLIESLFQTLSESAKQSEENGQADLLNVCVHLALLRYEMYTVGLAYTPENVPHWESIVIELVRALTGSMEPSRSSLSSDSVRNVGTLLLRYWEILDSDDFSNAPLDKELPLRNHEEVLSFAFSVFVEAVQEVPDIHGEPGFWMNTFNFATQAIIRGEPSETWVPVRKKALDAVRLLAEQERNPAAIRGYLRMLYQVFHIPDPNDTKRVNAAKNYARKNEHILREAIPLFMEFWNSDPDIYARGGDAIHILDLFEIYNGVLSGHLEPSGFDSGKSIFPLSIRVQIAKFSRPLCLQLMSLPIVRSSDSTRRFARAYFLHSQALAESFVLEKRSIDLETLVLESVSLIDSNVKAESANAITEDILVLRFLREALKGVRDPYRPELVIKVAEPMRDILSRRFQIKKLTNYDIDVDNSTINTVNALITHARRAIQR